MHKTQSSLSSADDLVKPPRHVKIIQSMELSGDLDVGYGHFPFLVSKLPRHPYKCLSLNYKITEFFTDSFQLLELFLVLGDIAFIIPDETDNIVCWGPLCFRRNI